MKKQFVCLSLLLLCLVAGCGGAVETNTEQGEPKIVEKEVEKSLSVNCMVVHTDDESDYDRDLTCDYDKILDAIDFWNRATSKNSLGNLFVLDPKNPSPDVMLIYHWSEFQAEKYEGQPENGRIAWLSPGASWWWEYIAQALGRAIGMPENESSDSIMQKLIEAEELETVKVLDTDIAALQKFIDDL